MIRWPNDLAPDWCWLLPGSPDPPPQWQSPAFNGQAEYLTGSESFNYYPLWEWRMFATADIMSRLSVACAYTVPPFSNSAQVLADRVSIYGMSAYTSLNPNVAASVYNIFGGDARYANSLSFNDPCYTQSNINSCYCSSRLAQNFTAFVLDPPDVRSGR
jgi:hypothetical protein